MKNILICDDERDIVEALKIYLSSDRDLNLLTAGDGMQAVEIARENKLSLILMDIMMPKMSGIAAVTQIRSFSNVPIILLTAKSEDTDKILGLNVGADDYITKPFNPMEVIARVHSQLRRYTDLGGHPAARNEIEIGDIILNDERKTVSVCGSPVALTPTEFNILKLLMQNPGKVYSSDQIYESVWDEEAFGSDNTVAVHIRHLREKIEINPAEPRYLKVIWGKGYKIEDEQ